MAKNVIDYRQSFKQKFEDSADDIDKGFLFIFDSMDDGILIADHQAAVLYVNAEYTRITGVKKEQIIGHALLSIRPGAVLPSVIKSGKPLAGIYRRENHIDYVVDMSPIAINDVIIGGLSIVRDITEVQQLSESLHKHKVREQKLTSTIRHVFKAKYCFDDIVYESHIMKNLIELAKRVANSDSNVLINGESGTGKELIAQAIHNHSRRADGPFVALNCATLTAPLAESELFGYEEGSFTGATKGGRMGAFEVANDGSILLDEIGDLNLELQAKLLRVLQEQGVRKVGKSVETPVNVRVIACTNRGFLTIILLLAAIISKKMSPMASLIIFPILGSLAAGQGLNTGKHIMSGISSISGMVAMFIFAILFFGVVTDAGMFDPIIKRILRFAGGNPTRIVVGSAVLAMIIHLDGSGAVTFLITIPAMLPLYERLNIDKRVLACVVALGAGVMNILPWGGPTLRAATALHLPVTEVFNPVLPAWAFGLIWVLGVAYMLGKKETARLGAYPGYFPIGWSYRC